MGNQPDESGADGFDMDALIAQVGDADFDVDGPVDEQKGAGGADAPPAADVPEVYYDYAAGCYWIENDKGGFVSVNQDSLRRILRAAGISDKPPKDGSLSILARLVVRFQKANYIDYAGMLAGYPVGLYEMEENRVLVTRSPKLIEPVPGEFPLIEQIIDGQLNHGDVDQRPYFWGWLKVAWEALASSHPRPGQALGLAGSRDTGKSLLQDLVTQMLGGKSAKPYQFMTGKTSFNGDMFECVHLKIDDEAAETSINARRKLGAELKIITVNRSQRCHAKYRKGVTLVPLWRLTISMNDEAENLMVLPPLDESIEDKIILLKVCRPDWPIETRTIADREEFWHALISELPHFVHFLREWEIPDRLASARFGITHFHHPDILSAISDLAPEERLLDIIDDVMFADFEFSDDEDWEGTAQELERKLLSNDAWGRESTKLLYFNTACGVYLGRLAKKYRNRVSSRRIHGRRLWSIKPPMRERRS